MGEPIPGGRCAEVIGSYLTFENGRAGFKIDFNLGEESLGSGSAMGGIGKMIWRSMVLMSFLREMARVELTVEIALGITGLSIKLNSNGGGALGRDVVWVWSGERDEGSVDGC